MSLNAKCVEVGVVLCCLEEQIPPSTSHRTFNSFSLYPSSNPFHLFSIPTSVDLIRLVSVASFFPSNFDSSLTSGFRGIYGETEFRFRLVHLTPHPDLRIYPLYIRVLTPVLLQYQVLCCPRRDRERVRYIWGIPDHVLCSLKGLVTNRGFVGRKPSV